MRMARTIKAIAVSKRVKPLSEVMPAIEQFLFFFIFSSLEIVFVF